jgi:hypothetical protein
VTFVVQSHVLLTTPCTCLSLGQLLGNPH